MENVSQAPQTCLEHGDQFFQNGTQIENLNKVRAYVNVIECYIKSFMDNIYFEYANVSGDQRKNISADEWAMNDILSKMKMPENLERDIFDFLNEIKAEYVNKQLNLHQDINKDHYTEALDIVNDIICMVNGIQEESEV